MLNNITNFRLAVTFSAPTPCPIMAGMVFQEMDSKTYFDDIFTNKDL